MCLIFADWSDEFRQGPITASSGGRTVAEARKVSGGWMLKGHGVCWLHPDARKPDAAGSVRPEVLVLETKQQALAEIQGLDNRN